MIVTFILSLILMASLFLMIWVAVSLVQSKKLFTTAPRAGILKRAVDLYEGTQDVFCLSDFTNHSLKPEVGMICSS